MSAQHTPGPWSYTGSHVYGAHGDFVADCNAFGQPKTAYINARLIAAAPELLHALQSALSALERSDTNLDSCLHTGINDTLGNVIHTAIAKAEGRA